MLKSAIILAGGFGTRLQSLVSDLPKPLAPVNHRPFLDYLLDYLSYFGLQRVCLSTGYLSEKISSRYGHAYKGMALFYKMEAQPMGTGGGIRQSMEEMNDEDLFVLNGDSFFDIDLLHFHDLHRKEKAQMSLALRQVENASRYGSIQLGQNNRITAFLEKKEDQQPGLINGGVYILNRKLFLENSPVQKAFSIEKDFFEKQCGQLMIRGFPFDSYFIDIGIPEDYLKAQNDFKQFKY